MKNRYIFLPFIFGILFSFAFFATGVQAQESSIPPNVLKVLEETGALDSPDAPPTTDVDDDILAASQQPPDEFYRGKVMEETRRGMVNLGGLEQEYQIVKVQVLEGPDKGSVVEINHGSLTTLRQDQFVKSGDRVVLIKLYQLDGTQYHILDHYRLVQLVIVSFIFLALAVYFGRARGAGAVIGLALSIVVLAYYVLPKIAAGADPFLVCLVGSGVIAFISMYLAHGFNRRATIALVSTLITLGLSAGIVYVFVWLTKLSGVGSEEAFYLQLGPTENLNFQGLLLGAIIIGALGVLEDITIGQAAAVDEIHQANSSFSFSELYRRGLSVGREHIAALVNTLALAYAGASFPLFLLFYTQSTQPVWVTLNSEMIVEELVRALVGSTTLVLAVPITTILTAYLWTRPSKAGKNQPDDELSEADFFRTKKKVS